MKNLSKLLHPKEETNATVDLWEKWTYYLSKIIRADEQIGKSEARLRKIQKGRSENILHVLLEWYQEKKINWQKSKLEKLKIVGLGDVLLERRKPVGLNKPDLKPSLKDVNEVLEIFDLFRASTSPFTKDDLLDKQCINKLIERALIISKAYQDGIKTDQSKGDISWESIREKMNEIDREIAAIQKQIDDKTNRKQERDNRARSIGAKGFWE